MPENTPKNRSREGNRDEGRSALAAKVVPVIILGVGLAAYLFFSREKEEAKRPPAAPRPLKTKVVELKVEDIPTTIETQGVVRAHNEVTLTAQVAGRIIRIDEQFEDGAFFDKDTVLVELDPADYNASVKAAEAQLAQAKAVHAQEKTRSEQARLNWEELGYDEEPNELVLRLPQLREAEARVDSANAALDQAKRDHARTRIRAPFDGRVLVRSVGLSQSVAAGTALGTVFAVDYAEVRLPIAGDQMRFLTLPEEPDDAPVEIALRDALDENNDAEWKAEIVRTEGALDLNSLELFAIARIPDPFGRASDLPPLRIGQPVTGDIPGRTLEDVIAVPRESVRQLNRIYLVDPEELTIRASVITPLWSDEERVVIRDGTIDDGTYLATTQMAFVPDGAKVEIEETPPDAEAEAAASGESNGASGVTGEDSGESSS